MSFDEKDALDELLEGRSAELEARFRELEQDAELERLRQETGAPPRPAPTGESPGPGAPNVSPAREDASPDPLADLKHALDGSGQLEQYLLVVCPHCAAKNRMSLTKVRRLTPLCGRCKKELAQGHLR